MRDSIVEDEKDSTRLSNLDQMNAYHADDYETSGGGWHMAGPSSPSICNDGDGDLSVFPPSLHEGLTPTLTLDPPSPSPSTSTSSSFSGIQVQVNIKEEASHVSRTPMSESARRLLGSGMELLRSRIALLRGGGGGGGAVWSFAALAGLAGILMYLRQRRRKRREKQLLLLLLLEKDERINQLMDHIVKMSEAIAGSYKVPVMTTT